MPCNRLLLCLTLVASITVSVSAQVDHDAHIKAIEQNLLEQDGEGSLTERMAHYRIPGVSIAVIDEYKIAWAKAYGTACAGSDRMLGTNTLFQSGSLAKPVAAVAVLSLVQQGRYELDRDVNTYLKSWKLIGPAYEENNPVTFRRLLSHTAGIGYERIVGYRRGAPLPTLLQILDGMPPAHNRPVRVEQISGSSFTYANASFLVIQLAIEETLELSYPQACSQLVFGPLGMNDSLFSHPLEDTLKPLAACGHTDDGSMVEGGWRDVPELGATGLWTTPSDISRYVIEIMNASTGREAKILSKASAREMLTPIKEDMGLSVFVYGKGNAMQIQHGGAAVGYRNMFIGYPAGGTGAVVMTNGDKGYDLIGEIMEAIAREYGWPE